jgi:hypothetical protein
MPHLLYFDWKVIEPFEDVEELEYPDDFTLAEEGNYVLDVSHIDPFAKSMVDVLDESIIG